MTGTADLISCANGFQVEISLSRNWTLYSTIYRGRQAAREAAESIATKLSFDLVWNEVEPSAP